MKRALVCGAGGFIAAHLCSLLKKKGYWIRGVDIKEHEFRSPDVNEFVIADLRDSKKAFDVLYLRGEEQFDEVYQLAADMGGMGFIHSKESDIMHNNVLINTNMIHAACQFRVPRYFYSSSVCIYRDMDFGEAPLKEEDAYPAQPDNEYGWEKLYSERLVKIHSKYYPIVTRIARFNNCFGSYGTWTGGREKAPAALCRKVAEAENGTSIDVWGDGSAVRSYIYVDDLVRGIYMLMHSDIEEPTNIGIDEYISVNELAQIIMDVAGKRLSINYIDGPVGVRSRNFSNERIYTTGWKPEFSTKQGIIETYPWIEKQVNG